MAVVCGIYVLSCYEAYVRFPVEATAYTAYRPTDTKRAPGSASRRTEGRAEDMATMLQGA